MGIFTKFKQARSEKKMKEFFAVLDASNETALSIWFNSNNIEDKFSNNLLNSYFKSRMDKLSDKRLKSLMAELKENENIKFKEEFFEYFENRLNIDS